MRTLVMGASKNPDRYSNMAIRMLTQAGHEVEGIGLKEVKVYGIEIQKGMPEFKNIDTVTLYLSPKNQTGYYDYILSLRPRRVIFNPGTENPEFISLLKSHGIETEIACTLVLLRTNNY